ncbi:ATP-binding protein [Alkalimonas sp. MEB108]|uniref:histidine kinase n=1 Tax=Alkalimonas cellulosilytica TaxID=3058395 RepID=A0ABU7J4M0_9GAMM|nr:ATP-binding protein [Alkalimonas sp. MEB108]MEE2001377.1 ATP-binding protein [Alkalimonas sp. MEB108]
MSEIDGLNQLPCAVLITNLQNELLFANQAAQAIQGITETESLLKLEQLLPRSAQIFLLTHVLPMLLKDTVINELYLDFLGKNKTVLPMLVNASLGSFEGQPCRRWVLFPAKHRAEFEQQLVKSRQQMHAFAVKAETERQVLQTVLDGVKDVAILALGADGSIVFANVGAETMFQTNQHVLIHQPIEAWLDIPLALRDIFATDEKNFPGNGSDEDRLKIAQDFETKLRVKSDAQLDVQVQLRKVEHISADAELSYILIITDIQKRKQYQMLQDNFVATVSHELRTPLTAMQGALKLLMNDKKSVLSAQAQKMSVIMLKNGERLQALINDILDFSNLETGQIHLQLQTVKLMPLLRQAINEHQFYLADKHIRIELLTDIPDIDVVVDKARLFQILNNLLSNAKKFSPAKSIVRITLEAQPASVKVSIIDCGPGIAEDFIPLLFSKFRQQNNSANREYEGSGLGLAICKQLTEALGGEIGYQPHNHGSIFWFTLPVQTPKNPNCLSSDPN